jgi:hypothetical protein
LARALVKGNKGVPAGVNGVKIPCLLSIAPKRTLAPYLHLVLGLTNNVGHAVKQMLAFLTSLGCVDPAVTLRHFDHCALLAELEETVAAVVDDLVDVLHSRQVKAQVKQLAVSEMEKVPTPAALAATPSGVAAPTGAE